MKSIDREKKEANSSLFYRSNILRKKNIPYLYDLYLTHKTELPYVTCQFMPEKIHRGDYGSQKLILGQQCIASSPNHQPHLIIAEMNLPYVMTEIHEQESYLDADSSQISEEILEQKIGRVEITVCIPHEGDVNKARYCPQKSQLIATKSSDGHVTIFDYKQYQSRPVEEISFDPTIKLEGHGKAEGFGLSWNPNNQGFLLSCSYDRLICMWDINAIGGNKNSIQPHSTYRSHDGCVEDVTWHPFNKQVFGSVSDDGFISLWDVRKGEEALAQNYENGEANSLSFSPYNEEILSVGFLDGTLSIIDLRQMSTPLFSLKGHYNAVRQICFSPHFANVLASGSDDGAVCIWNLSRSFSEKSSPVNVKTKMGSCQSCKPIELSFLHGGYSSPVNDLAWNPSDPYVLINSNNEESCIWQPSDHFLKLP
jgi:histone-binding protein RBBP4